MGCKHSPLSQFNDILNEEWVGDSNLNSKNGYTKANREDRLYKIATITLYTVTILWLYILSNTPTARGYEISIYNAYPLFFWYLFSLTMILGISLTIYFIVKGVNLWRYSILSILIADTIVLFLPAIRNYEFYALGGSDIFAHLAWSKYILNTGHLSSADLYPATHILIATQHQLYLPNSALLATIISFVFFILYVLSLFLLGGVIFNDNRAGAIFSIFGLPLLFSLAHYAFIPFSFALFLFPLIFFIIRKIEVSERRGAYYISFIVFALFIVFCHPMITLILLLILGTLYGYTQICDRFQLEFAYRFDVLKMASIVGIIFVFWYINFQSILNMGERTISALLGMDDTETILSYNLDMVGQSEASLFKVIDVFIKNYGPITIYFGIALCIVIYLLKEFVTKRKYADEIIYITFFLLSIAFGAVLTLGHFVVFELIRATSFAIIMATIICGIGSYNFFKNAGISKRKKIFTLIITVMLCSVSILSTFSVYPSPWKFSASNHMTELDISGIDWYLIKQDGSIPLYSEKPWSKYFRYFQEIHAIPVQQPQVVTGKLPPHFGYDQNRCLIQSFDDFEGEGFYLATNEQLRQQFLVYAEGFRSLRNNFSKSDFSRLNNDNIALKIYVNGEWELWRAN